MFYERRTAWARGPRSGYGRGIRTLALLSGLALLLVACGDTGEAEEPDEGEEAAPDESGDADLDTDDIEERDFGIPSHLPVEHATHAETVGRFIDLVDEATDGKFTFTEYPSQQLGDASETLNMLDTGVAEMAYFTIAYHPEELPLSQAYSLPTGLTPTQMVSAYWEAMHRDGPIRDELQSNGMVPLVINGTAGYEFSTVSDPLPDREALAGLRIRGGGDIHQQIIERAGGTAVPLTTPEMYEGLDRGTIDGTLYQFSSWPGLGVDELLEHTTVGLELAPLVPNGLVTSDTIWAELSDTEKQILYDAGHQASVEGHQALAELDVQTLEDMIEERDLTTYEWSGEDREGLLDELEAILDEWIELRDGQGLDGAGVVDEMFEIAESQNAEADQIELTAYGLDEFGY